MISGGVVSMNSLGILNSVLVQESVAGVAFQSSSLTRQLSSTVQGTN